MYPDKEKAYHDALTDILKQSQEYNGDLQAISIKQVYSGPEQQIIATANVKQRLQSNIVVGKDKPTTY